jgi:DNA-binding FadR family transcriptional regulator
MADMVLERATDSDMEALEQINERIRQAAEISPDDLILLRDLNIDFHRHMMAITQNKFIVKMGTAIYTLYRTSSEKVLSSDPLVDYNHHKKLMEFIRKKDKDGLLQYTRGVINWVLKKVKK